MLLIICTFLFNSIMLLFSSSWLLPFPTTQHRAESDELPQCNTWGPVGPHMVISPLFSADKTIFAWGNPPSGYTFTNLLIKSIDGGLSWSELSVTEPTFFEDLRFSQNYAADQTLYFASAYTNSVASIMRSGNGGEEWSSIPFSQSKGIKSMQVFDPDTLFVGTYGGPPSWYPDQGFFLLTDGDQSWQRTYQGGVSDIAISPNYTDDLTILIGIAGYHWNGGILKSTDGGHSWKPSREGLNWGSDGGTTDILFSPNYAVDHTVFTVNWDTLYKLID